MKRYIKKSVIMPMLAVALGSVLAGQVPAQTITVLHSSTGGNTGPEGVDGRCAVLPR